MRPVSRAHSRARGTRFGLVAVGLLTVVLGAGIGPTAGASPLTPTTTAAPAVTTTTTATTPTAPTTTVPGTVTSTPGPTIPGASTTTTTIKLPVFKGVSAPPMAVTPVADPKKIALAAHLALLIAAQSAALDKLAVTYGLAQGAAQVAADDTAAAVTKLDESRAAEVVARANVLAAQAGLRSAAINAYPSSSSGPLPTTSACTSATA